jgi:flavin-dependent dehydrogenase
MAEELVIMRDLGRLARRFIGTGHNGLTCAYYLAKKGLKVAILEAAGNVGGAAITDEFLPFRNRPPLHRQPAQPEVIAT